MKIRKARQKLADGFVDNVLPGEMHDEQDPEAVLEATHHLEEALRILKANRPSARHRNFQTLDMSFARAEDLIEQALEFVADMEIHI